MRFAKIPRDEQLRIATHTLNNKIIDHCHTLPRRFNDGYEKMERFISKS